MLSRDVGSTPTYVPFNISNMRIRNKTVLVYDIEVFRNVFHCTILNTETNEYYKFEISERKNQLEELVTFFKRLDGSVRFGQLFTMDIKLDTDVIFAGYNNIHYDNPIINYIIDYYNILKNKNYLQVCQSIYNLSKIITSKEASTELWRKWKYQVWFESFDILTMLYSDKLRVGLKDIQVTMEYNNVQEFVYDWDSSLLVKYIDSMIEYNINDVNSTYELLLRNKDAVKLRLAIEDKYNVRVLSKDGVNIGMKILTQEYLKRTGLTWYDIEGLRSPMDLIPLKDVILPFIKYNDPILTKMLSTLKEQIVPPGNKGYEYQFLYNNVAYTVGVGGLHTKNDADTIIAAEDEILIDIDVASLYPSMLLQYDFYPKHLGPEFKEAYSDIRNRRLEAKKIGDKETDATLKLALNGLSGNLQNEHNFCYSPFAVMQIRMNGQLLLLMLAESLTEIGCKIIQANTDGLFVLLKKDIYEKAKEVYHKWEQLTGLVLEEDRFTAMWQLNVNNYIAVKEGYYQAMKSFLEGKEVKDNKGRILDTVEKVENYYIKKKGGSFLTEVELGKGLSAKIIPIAVQRYLVDKIPIEDTIYQCTDIKKFLMAQKVNKEFNIEYNNQTIQRTNRFYASTSGPYLYKYKVAQEETVKYKKVKGIKVIDKVIKKGEKYAYTNLLTSSGVIILNKFDDIPISERKINYRYYVAECNKIINKFEQKQLSLW